MLRKEFCYIYKYNIDTQENIDIRITLYIELLTNTNTLEYK